MKIRNSFVMFSAVMFLYIFGVFRIYNIKPELMLVFICIYSNMRKLSIYSLVYGVLSAVVMHGFGNRSFLFTVVFVLVIIMVNSVRKTHFVSITAFAFYEIFYYLIYYLGKVSPSHAILNIILPLTLSHSIIYFFVYKICKIKSLKRGQSTCKTLV